MYKGIYIAASGMTLRQQQIDTIAQNIANVSTTGYKRDDMAFEQYLMQPDTAPGGVSDGRSMAQIGTVATDYTSGDFIHTGNPLDVAVTGDSFLAMEGDTYTKRGDFTLNTKGEIVDQQGKTVQGQNGVINIGSLQGPVSIGPDGSVSVGGQFVDKLKIVKFTDTSKLQRVGYSNFKSDEQPQAVTSPDVRQGFLEASNVNAIEEMVKMIAAQREFESYQGIITSFDNAASKVSNDMARG